MSMGTSYSKMAAEARLVMACHLLVESDQSISSIARRVGYSEASSFSRIFVRLMKISPMIYRRQQMAQRVGERYRDGKRLDRPNKAR